jgi:hypothetical protein
VRDDDTRYTDAHDEQRKHDDEHQEHGELLARESAGALLERHGVCFELLLLVFQTPILIVGALVEDLSQLGIACVHRVFDDVHVDDGRHLAALAEDFLSTLHRFLALFHRLLALRDDLAADRPQQPSQGERENDGNPDEEARVFELEVAVEEVVLDVALVASALGHGCAGHGNRHG